MILHPVLWLSWLNLAHRTVFRTSLAASCGEVAFQPLRCKRISRQSQQIGRKLQTTEVDRILVKIASSVSIVGWLTMAQYSNTNMYYVIHLYTRFHKFCKGHFCRIARATNLFILVSKFQ
jgi:hypothetical protein